MADGLLRLHAQDGAPAVGYGVADLRSIILARLEQPGFKVEVKKGTIDVVVVVDHVEKPSEN